MKGKVAIVTGGTKGIGFAIAEALLKEGATVFICGRAKRDLNQATEWLSKHGPVESDVCDVRSEEQVRMLIAECERRLGGCLAGARCLDQGRGKALSPRPKQVLNPRGAGETRPEREAR